MKVSLSRVSASLLVIGRTTASDGCPEGEVLCGAFDGYDGYCTSLCCDIMTEEPCFSDDASFEPYCALISDGGCPCKLDEVRCEVSQYSIGYCADVCPCPDGEVRCGAFEGFEGICTTICCAESEETCYDENWEPLYCKAKSEGGCPCPDGQSRCGATEFDLGYCTDMCCDLTIAGKMIIWIHRHAAELSCNLLFYY